MSIQSGLGDLIPLSRLHNAAVICLLGIGKPEASMFWGNAASAAPLLPTLAGSGYSGTHRCCVPIVESSKFPGLPTSPMLLRPPATAQHCMFGALPVTLQTVELHLQRLGAAHIEACGDYEDHHMFSLEEVSAAIT